MNIDKEKSKEIALENEYRKLVSTLYSQTSVYQKWEKTGDVYKKYSIYDTSKYETVLSSSLMIKK